MTNSPAPTDLGPGVYVQELPNPVQPIVGVTTSVTAFYGPAPKGQVDDPYQVNSWADYEIEFGNLDRNYPLSYAVYLFFLNGGMTALVVRCNDPAVQTAASAQLSSDITLEASSPGDWGTQLSYSIDDNDLLDRNVNKFNLTITQTQGTTLLAQEVYSGANLIKPVPGQSSPHYLPTLLQASNLVIGASGNKWTMQPAATPVDKNGNPQPAPFSIPAAAAGTSGGGAAGDAGGGAAGDGAVGAPPAGGADDTSEPIPYIGLPNQKTGIYALLKADIFNILCLPAIPPARSTLRRSWSRRPHSRAATRHADRRPAIELGEDPARLRHHY